MAFVWLMSFLERQRKRNGDRLPIGARRPRRRSLEGNELWVQDDRLPYGHIMDVFALFPTRKINNRQEPPASGTSNPFAFVCRANANRSHSDPHTYSHKERQTNTFKSWFHGDQEARISFPARVRKGIEQYPTERWRSTRMSAMVSCALHLHLHIYHFPTCSAKASPIILQMVILSRKFPPSIFRSFAVSRILGSVFEGVRLFKIAVSFRKICIQGATGVRCTRCDKRNIN